MICDVRFIPLVVKLRAPPHGLLANPFRDKTESRSRQAAEQMTPQKAEDVHSS